MRSEQQLATATAMYREMGIDVWLGKAETALAAAAPWQRE